MADAKRALITGITGQDGSYLAELLLEKGYDVHGMVRRSSTRDLPAPRAGSATTSRCTPATCSTSARWSTCSASVEPDEIYNLAAMSFVAASWSPAGADRASSPAVGVTRMLEAMREVTPGRCASTRRRRSEMFGKVPEVPQTETTPFYPRSPYGVAKVYGHFITVNYRETLRPARLLGDPLQPRVAAPRPRVRDAQGHPRRRRRSSSASQTSCALGNLDAERDWGYAKDYVEAMWLMLQQDEPDDYVIATGETHSVRELVDVGLRARRPRPRGPRGGSTRSSCGPPRSSSWWATPRRRGRSWAGSRARLRGMIGADGRRRTSSC